MQKTTEDQNTSPSKTTNQTNKYVLTYIYGTPTPFHKDNIVLYCIALSCVKDLHFWFAQLKKFSLLIND